MVLVSSVETSLVQVSTNVHECANDEMDCLQLGNYEYFHWTRRVLNDSLTNLEIGSTRVLVIMNWPERIKNPTTR